MTPEGKRVWGWTAVFMTLPWVSLGLGIVFPPAAIPAVLFLRFPIRLFDALTGGAFKPQGGGFIVFPTLPQLGFALLFDLAAAYLLARAVCFLLARRYSRGGGPGRVG